MSDERRQQIVDAARQLYEEQGLSATTVKDISERCGVARSLFYHYFRDKQEVTSAVIDDFVNDYIESLQLWNEQRTPGDIEGSLAGVVTVMRVGVFEHSSFRRALDTHENASLYLEFINRVADRMAAYFVETTVQDYAQNHPIDIDHVYETFYILIMGICGYVRTHRDAPDEVLRDIIGDRPAGVEDPQRMQANQFFIQINQNGQSQNVSLGDARNYSDRDKKEIIDSLYQPIGEAEAEEIMDT